MLIRLTYARGLLVIDNIEQDIEVTNLDKKLIGLCGRSKIVVTSRNQPIDLYGGQVISLGEIEVGDILKLLQEQSKLLGIPISNKEVKKITQETYMIIGGNPLAIKLVAGLLKVLPFSQIIKSFRVAKINSVNSMYKDIYWKSWDTLSQQAKDLLQVMPQISDVGAGLDHLQFVSDIPANILPSIIEELFSRSLLEIRGGWEEPRYGIHRLTHAFLMSEIIKYPNHQMFDE